MNDLPQKILVWRLNLYGWVVFLLVTVFSFSFLPLEMNTSVVMGGLIVLANLALLYAFVTRAMAPGAKVHIWTVIIKFYLAFAVTAIVIAALIFSGLADPIGLLIGLGVFVLNVFLTVAHAAASVIFKTIKEAV